MNVNVSRSAVTSLILADANPLKNKTYCSGIVQASTATLLSKVNVGRYLAETDLGKTLILQEPLDF